MPAEASACAMSLFVEESPVPDPWMNSTAGRLPGASMGSRTIASTCLPPLTVSVRCVSLEFMRSFGNAPYSGYEIYYH